MKNDDNDEAYLRVGRVTTESVHKCTGKHWKEWVALLDKAGGRSLTHQELVALLKKRYKLGPWWQQGVTLGYELAIGRRIEGQDLKGKYTLTATKSLHVSAATAWKTLLSEKGLAAWLMPLSPLSLKPGAQFETRDGYFGEVRTMKAGSRIRLSWQDPNWDKKTTLEVLLVPRPKKQKSLLAINHNGIAHVKSQTALRARWKRAILDFCATIESEVG